MIVAGKVGEVIGALLTENGAYRFCDTSIQSGKDYRRGIQSLFEGNMAAYRNPSSHENQTLSKAEDVVGWMKGPDGGAVPIRNVSNGEAAEVGRESNHVTLFLNGMNILCRTGF